MIISDKGQIIRIKISAISTMGRNTQGVTLIKLNDNEKVVAIESLAEKEEDENKEGSTDQLQLGQDDETQTTSEESEAGETTESSDTSDSNNNDDNGV